MSKLLGTVVSTLVSFFIVIPETIAPQIPIQQVVVETKIEEVIEIPFVSNLELQGVANCESWNRQFEDDGKTPLWSRVKGEKSVGKFQINMKEHATTSQKMGLDVINSERDNTIFALYLYKKNGLRDWSGSFSCWKHEIPKLFNAHYEKALTQKP